ncbi:DUF2974 domain-containing protein [Lysobacter pythonis]|uniref:DUF2974 domain-containing protein n=1 Tax=Solilutibacter pythonis TaxID=2483112 RepID=A0A3M2HVU2_9GAMM|nr:DUF2974 domain-containing protein [Lysobacter pythonis]RMH93138.1 DUF2974 domain-containing protein [Lysobacter pythonis]
MSITPQQYADLAADSYRERSPGIRSPGEEEPVISGGVKFEVLEHVENRFNGYAGTIYQRVDTGEIVVAHRGTNEVLRDGILTDAGMVISRMNAQQDDALELTKRALQEAQKNARYNGGKAPEVTVTGHSLGGTLTQITAHHYGLRGETFNAYGSVSLYRRIPEGGDKVVNHVMASDVVSAASPHYGQVRVYAKPDEIQRLQRFRYDNGPGGLLDLMDRDAVNVAARSLNAHSMHLFTDKDANGGPDIPVMADPAAKRLAADNAAMIDKYRSDVLTLRRGVSAIMGGPLNGMRIGVDLFLDPIEPGMGREKPPYSLPEPSPFQQDVETIIQEMDKYFPNRSPGSTNPSNRPAPAERGLPGFESSPFQQDVETIIREMDKYFPNRSPGSTNPSGHPAPAERELLEDVQRYLQRGYPAAPTGMPGKQSSLERDPESYVDRMLAAARSGDHEQFRALTQQAANTTAGQQLRQDAIAQVDSQEREQEQQARLAQQQQEQQQQQQAMQGPRMRM